MKEVYVTTSWDDGHSLDTRLSALLEKYGIKATFYISPRDHEFSAAERLSDAGIQKLSQSFEIGAHTMTHPRLHKVSDTVAREEIISSKRYLEKLLGKKIVSFCYPGGSYRKSHLPMVQEAGFSYARTVRRFDYGFTGTPFEAKTTINTYNHYQDLWKIAKFAGFNLRKTRNYFQWDNLAKAMFDRVLEHGGVFHLWGHSWEIDQHDDWQKLEDVLSYIADKKQVRYITNGELMAFKPKRLLLAAPYFPPHLGGSEFYAYNIGHLLQENFGWEVCVVTSGQRGLWNIAEDSYKGLRVYFLPYWLKLSNTPLNPLWYFMLKRILKKEAITLVNAHAPVPYLADVVVQGADKTPTVLTYHMGTMKKGSRGVDALIGLYERQLLPRTLRATSKIITASNEVSEMLMRDYQPRTTTVTPGVDTNFFRPAHNTPGSTLLFVGSLEKSTSYKGLRYLLEALAMVAEKHPDSRLVVVGNGDAKSLYEMQAQELGIKERVVFTGAQYGKDLLRRYQTADLLVLPSLSESFGMVAVEAMACGVPVVGSRVGGIPAVVRDTKTGYLVPPADSQALAERISNLLDHPKTIRRLGQEARKWTKAAFTWEARAEQTNQLFSELIGVPVSEKRL